MIPQQYRDGFMMTELLVSLAILAFALVALFGLKRDVNHRQEIELKLIEAASVEANGLSLLRRVNPLQEPVGSRTIGKDLILKWRAIQLGKARPVLQWRGRETPYSAALFSVRYTVLRKGAEIARGNLDLVGWTGPGNRQPAEPTVR